MTVDEEIKLLRDSARAQALQLANMHHEPEEQTIARAAAYYSFLVAEMKQ